MWRFLPPDEGRMIRSKLRREMKGKPKLRSKILYSLMVEQIVKKRYWEFNKRTLKAVLPSI